MDMDVWDEYYASRERRAEKPKFLNPLIKIGDRITKRGSEGAGEVIDIKGLWASIKWDDGPLPRERPRMCHVAELEKSTEQE